MKMKHDLKWFEEYAKFADISVPLTKEEWKELAALLHDINSRDCHIPNTSTDLLSSLTEECRRMIDASGLEDGPGGGWEKYDCLMVELRKRLKVAESYLADKQLNTKQTRRKPHEDETGTLRRDQTPDRRAHRN